MVGTLAYISPEQARGHAAGATSDLYAAGIILYRVLTGEVPFTGSATEVAKAHVNEVPRAPSTFELKLKEFDTFFERVLAKDPTARFQSAADLWGELETVLKLTKSQLDGANRTKQTLNS